MAKTKRTERKQPGSGLPRAEFPMSTSESEDSPNSPEQEEAAAPRVAEAPREEPEVQGARPREMNQLLRQANSHPGRLCCLGTQP